MLKFDFEDTVASPPGPFGWCPLLGTMWGPQCLLLTQLRVSFAPRIVFNINSLEANWSLRCNRHSTIIFDSHFFKLGHPLAGDIPSMFFV